MIRTTALFALVAAAAAAFATLARSQDEDAATPRFGPAYDDAPAFDGGLPAGTTDIARHGIHWAERKPGYLVAGRSSDWPAAIERSFIERACALTKDGERPMRATSSSEDGGLEWPEELKGHRAVLPGGLELYAAKHAGPYAPGQVLQVLLREPSTGRMSERAGVFGLRWTHVGPDGPAARWADLDGDGAMEVGFRLHFHNGTADDGDFERWFRITDELELEQVHVSLLWDWVSVVSRRERGRIDYRLLRDRDGTLRDEGWFTNPAFGVGPVLAEHREVTFEYTEPYSRH